MIKQTRNKRISIVTFIDALGWEVLKDRRFLESELPYRRKLRSVFGFSSACVPSILTGRHPQEHNHWSFFFYAPDTSPFKPLRWLKFLPRSLTDRGRVRSQISKLVKWFYRYDGYFQLYNVPFEDLGYFDYCEKRDLFKPGGINDGQSIFDVLSERGIDYHVSDWRDSEPSNLQSLKHDLEDGDITFAFVYLADMDALLHRVGKESAEVDAKLAWYEEALRGVLETADQHYDEVRLHVCSDHGMATVQTTIDIKSKVEELGYAYGHDYVAVYDSTMARFWFHDAQARTGIEELLESISLGRVLENDELESLGCRFEADRFGELIFLTDPGVLIVPSHMGSQPLTGMHGYHPDHPDSDASLLSNVPAPCKAECITDIYDLMCAEAGT